jgi:hypothetical protein
LFPPKAFLSIAFVNGEFERLVLGAGPDPGIGSITSVANDDIADQDVEQAIGASGAQEHHPGPAPLVVGHQHQEPQAGKAEDGQTDPVGEVFLFVQFVIAA